MVQEVTRDGTVVWQLNDDVGTFYLDFGIYRAYHLDQLYSNRVLQP